VQWSPRGDHFVTVAGFMPAKTTVFTAACKPHFDLGSGPHNMARWSPQARRPARCAAPCRRGRSSAGARGGALRLAACPARDALPGRGSAVGRVPVRAA